MGSTSILGKLHAYLVEFAVRLQIWTLDVYVQNDTLEERLELILSRKQESCLLHHAGRDQSIPSSGIL
jgi:hypothetical protein